MPRTRRDSAPRRQVIAFVDDELAGRIEREAESNGVSKSEVIRIYLEAGIAAAEEKVVLTVNGKRYYQAD